MGLITRQYNYIAGRTIRASELNKNESVVYDAVNGNLEDINLKNATLTERVFKDDANPLSRDADKYLSFIASGLEVSDASSNGIAKVAITAGTAYTTYNGKMHRKTTSGETYALTNLQNGTYYLHTDYQGTYYDTDSADPLSGRQVIAKLVVTGQPSTPSISVTDLRRSKLYDTPSNYITGCILKYEGATSLSVGAGEAEIQNIFLKNTAGSPSIDITSAGNYFEGSVAGTSAWCYVYIARYGASLQWEVKLSSSAPQYSDTNGNANGILMYRKSGSVYYRCVGAVYRASGGNILKFYQNGDYFQYDAFQSVSAGSASNANVPAISFIGNFLLETVTSSGQYAQAKIRPSGSSGDFMIVGRPVADPHESYYSASFACALNSSRQIDFEQNKNSGATATCKTIGFWVNIR